MDQVHYSHITVEHSTPREYFNEISQEFDFGLDVCATRFNAKCMRYYTKPIDGLKQNWLRDAAGRTAWMNPPYGEPEHPCKPNCKKKICQQRGHHSDQYIPGIKDWIKKSWLESQRGLTTVNLLPSRTDTSWWHRYIWDETTNIWRKGVEGRLLKGRLKYGDCDNTAPFPNALIIFRGSRS